MLVGDETRAGFGITFWVGSDGNRINAGGGGASGPLDAHSLRHKLQTLRPGDVVLLTNVALSHFKKVVYGQSLKRKIGGGGWETGVTLLHRPGSGKGVMKDLRDISAAGVEPTMMAKVRRVVEWTRRFVNLGSVGIDVGVEIGHGTDGDMGHLERKGLKRRRERELQEELDLPPDDTP